MGERIQHLLSVGMVALIFTGAMNGTASARAACDRACLNGYIDQTLDAMVAHDPARLPLSATVKYTENAQQMATGDGLWATISADSRYRLYFADEKAGQAGFFGVIQEHGLAAIFSLRLKIAQRRITEIEVIVARQGALLYNPAGIATPKPVMLQHLEPQQRTPRDGMIAITHRYFDGIEQGNGDIVPFADECNRTENGTQTTNNTTLTRPPEQGFSVLALPCKEQLSTGFFAYIGGIQPRRILLVDEERGLVYGVFMFLHPGRMETVTIRGVGEVNLPQFAKVPSTVMVAELFKIERGKIREIEAVMTGLPYRAKTGWE